MIAGWIAYTLLVTAVLACAAAAIERLTPELTRRRRWVWVAVLASSGLLPIWSAARSAVAVPVASRGAGQASLAPGADTGSAGLGQRLAAWLARADASTLDRLDTPLTLGWAAAIVLAFGAYGIATWTLVSRRRRWRSTHVGGEHVLVSDAVGPAVIGTFRPRIVVPEWTLELPAERQRLMLAHEREHIRARDPLLLHASAITVLLMPWNVAAWWVLRRLRLAVEMDCDARVLATGSDVRAYGELLLDVCARRTRDGLVLAPALLERTSSLTRRILAMHPAPRRIAPARVAVAVGMGFGAAVVACELPSPDVVAPRTIAEGTWRPAGSVRIATSARGNEREIVRRYFPQVASGEDGASVLFLVEAADGRVVLTETTPAPDVPGSGGRAAPRDAEAAQGAARTASPSLPTRIAGLSPDAIASVDVVKRPPGTIAPSAVTLIRIRLASGAAAEAPVTGPGQ